MPRRRPTRALLRLVALLAGGYLLVGAGLFLAQGALLFHPERTRLPDAAWRAAIEDGARPLSVPVAGGAHTLEGLFLPADAPSATERRGGGSVDEDAFREDAAREPAAREDADDTAHEDADDTAREDADDTAHEEPDGDGAGEAPGVRAAGVEAAGVEAADAEPRAPRPALIYFGGNAETLHPDREPFPSLRAAGVHVALVAYRGYGRSGGAPSGPALLEDALLTYDAVAALPQVDADAIAVWGRSLGSGVATHVGAHRPVRALVLVSPYTRLSDAAADHYPWLPVRLLFRHEIDSAANAQAIDRPALLFHGTEDRVVPFAQGASLADAWPSARLIVLEGRGHGDLESTEAYPEEALRFLRTHLP
ncbi:MAG TPA: alpha/beta hydrolase [Polyangiaceae bacterium LLY-WYZ-15_(1-7)]|nr:alpha/beta hydrolase [Polyangiaceae bacterium LLY-WYZ-15_(1-7)]HJL07856.1 alpha/beta hydrolase [Polyangiaceae bacterium LLY-WYZ-15_(1-7)]HJL26287.1 alpha/beta hydrolase [Polyangiaceae bacterium LLY-WYZ-15_(1-7)]HJL32716.1 alpha/beta hydrolase [Polyangiaceae bacterium LLY-WYZ-15_(1-7)]HJL45498.1 alpha/beta hydrolase [Polyangiaceae bacterium LLY-WYZ-15_(1-7)]